MPHPQNACTSSCAICNSVAKVNDGTIFSAWKTILEIKPDLQRRSVYSAIVLSKCTDFSQTQTNCECAQIFSALLISLRVILHGWQWKTGVFGKRYTSAVHSLYPLREVAMSFRKSGVPEGRVSLAYVNLQKKEYKSPAFQSNPETLFFSLFH